MTTEKLIRRAEAIVEASEERTKLDIQLNERIAKLEKEFKKLEFLKVIGEIYEKIFIRNKRH